MLDILDELAPLVLATPWDKCGLQVASFREEICHVAVGLDPHPHFVQEALEKGSDFLLTHHPLTMSPKFPDKLDAYHRVLSLLFGHNVCLYSAHTCLDSMPYGAPVWLADALGLADCSVLEKTGSVQERANSPLKKSANINDNYEISAGIGCIGNLPKPLQGNDLLLLLRKYLPDAKPFFLIGKLTGEISRIAICPGSGSSLMQTAKDLGAQLFITGDIKYHTAVEVVDSFNGVYNDVPLALLDVGHFSLEEEMMRRFSVQLQEKLFQEKSDVRVTFIPSMDPFASSVE